MLCHVFPMKKEEKEGLMRQAQEKFTLVLQFFTCFSHEKAEKGVFPENITFRL